MIIIICDYCGIYFCLQCNDLEHHKYEEIKYELNKYDNDQFFGKMCKFTAFRQK